MHSSKCREDNRGMWILSTPNSPQFLVLEASAINTCSEEQNPCHLNGKLQLFTREDSPGSDMIYWQSILRELIRHIISDAIFAVWMAFQRIGEEHMGTLYDIAKSGIMDLTMSRLLIINRPIVSSETLFVLKSHDAASLIISCSLPLCYFFYFFSSNSTYGTGI